MSIRRLYIHKLYICTSILLVKYIMANLVTSNSMQHQITHNPAIAADIINAASSNNSKNDEVKKAKNINNLRGSNPIPTLHRHLLKQGYAFKKGRLHTGWKKRFFELVW